MQPLAVVFLTFNRPDAATRSLDRIRDVRPGHLFFVSDGARSDRKGEWELVRQTRSLADTIDWSCEVHRLFSETNMGCARRVSTAVTEALTVVDRVVVLEDDCIADPNFFTYCQSVLSRFEDDQRVMSVTGNNFQRGTSRGSGSYYFSKYPHCWGWATWKRAWDLFDLSLSRWPDARDQKTVTDFCQDATEYQYWSDIFDRVFHRQVDSWAYAWVFACWLHHGLTVTPNVNLVSNIGDGDNATHTRKRSAMIGIPTQRIDRIRHNDQVTRDTLADQFTDSWVFSGANRPSVFKKLRRKLGLTRRRAT